jgi:hypothetical protein
MIVDVMKKNKIYAYLSLMNIYIYIYIIRYLESEKDIIEISYLIIISL